MKNLRRVLALVIVFAMVLGCTAAFAAVPKFTDLNDADQQVVGVLAHLNLIQGYQEEDGTYTFKGDQTITRAEFAAVITRMLGMEATAKTQVPTQFSDVPQSHWASGYVSAAAGKKIIVGYGDGTFGPENPVKYEEAVKMLVCALGYEPQAASEGGYPTGHLFVAQRINLLSGANGYAGEDAKRLTVATLCYNGIDIPLMEQSVWGTGTPVYEIYDGTNGLPRKTIMSEYLNLIKLAGVVTDNENSSTSLEGLVSLKITDNFDTKYSTDTRYKVNNTTDLQVGDTRAKDFIGFSVIVYATYESNKSIDPTIVFIEEETRKGKITIDIDNLKEAVESGSNIAVTYYTDKDNNKTTKAYIPSAGTFFVNNNKVTYTGANFATDINNGKYEDVSGTIEFVSTSSKGTADYDSVFITAWNNFVVDSVNTNLYKILSSDESPMSGNISFDPSDKDIITTIVDENGATVDPTTLEANDVLSIKLSLDDSKIFPISIGRSTSTKDIYDCTLVRKTVTGTVTELDPEDTKVAVIDGTEYKIDPSAVDNLNLKTQDTGTFYLDAMGKIVAFDGESSVGNYAVLLYAEGADGINSARVKMLTPDGKISTKYFASRIKTPTTSVKNGVTQYQEVSVEARTFAAEIIANSVDYYGKVFKYKQNASNQLTSVFFSLTDAYETPEDSESYVEYLKSVESANHLATNILDAKGGKIDAENTTEKSLSVNDQTYWFDAKTVVINIDTTTAVDFSDVTESDVNVWDVTTLSYDQDFSKNGNATVSVFDTSSDGKPALVVVYGSAPIDDPTRAVALIKEVRDTQNADGEDIVKLNAYVTATGDIESYSLATDCAFNGAVGSAFVPTSYSSTLNEVKKLEVLTDVDFDLDTVEATDTLLDKEPTNNVEYFFGKVTRKSGSTITLYDEIKEKSVNRIISKSLSVLECDLRLPKANAIKVRTIDDIELEKNTMDGKTLDSTVSEYKVLIRVYKSAVADVVLYILPATN